MGLSYDTCKVCGERGRPSSMSGGTVYSFACTAEMVRMHDGTQREIKPCPDFEGSSQTRTIGSRRNK